MCLAAYIPAAAAASFTKEMALNAFTHNSDGFGVMAVRNGRLVVAKTLGHFGKAWSLYQSFDGLDRVIHFRYATHGAKDYNNCHPFTILDMDKGHAYDLGMVHNGVISSFSDHKSAHSDTALFVSTFLAPLLSAAPEVPFEEAGKDALSTLIDWSKLIFMDHNGRVSIVNEESGKWKDGCWYSNDYSLTPFSYAGAYGGWSNVDDEDYATWWLKKAQGKNGATVVRPAEGTAGRSIIVLDNKGQQAALPFDCDPNLTDADFEKIGACAIEKATARILDARATPVEESEDAGLERYIQHSEGVSIGKTWNDVTNMSDAELQDWIFDQPDEAESFLAQAWEDTGLMAQDVAIMVAQTLFTRLDQASLGDIIRDAID